MSDVMALLGFVALLVLLVPRLWREQRYQKDHELDSSQAVSMQGPKPSNSFNTGQPKYLAKKRLLSSAREGRPPSPA